ncbi:MAG: hypothetical protein QXY53_01035 [Desulfurococcaceae archaeon]
MSIRYYFEFIALILIALLLNSSLTTPQSTTTRYYWLNMYYSDQSLTDPSSVSIIQDGFLVSSRIGITGDKIAVFKIDESGNISWSIALDSKGKSMNRIVGLGVRHVLVNTIEGYPSKIELQFLGLDGTVLTPIHLSNPHWFNIHVQAVSTFENRLFLIIAESLTQRIAVILVDNLGRVMDSRRISFRGIDLTNLKIDGLCYSRDAGAVVTAIVVKNKILLVSLDSWNARIKWIRTLEYSINTSNIEIRGLSCTANYYVILTNLIESGISKPYVSFVSINGEKAVHLVIEGIDNYTPISSVNYGDRIVIAGTTENPAEKPKLVLTILNSEWSVLDSIEISINNVSRYIGVEPVKDGFLIWGKSIVRNVDGLFLFKIKDIMNIPRFESLSSDSISVNVNVLDSNLSTVSFSEESFSPTSEFSRSPIASNLVIRVERMYSYVEVGESMIKPGVEEKVVDMKSVKTGSLTILLVPILIPLVVTSILFIYLTIKTKSLSSRRS